MLKKTAHHNRLLKTLWSNLLITLLLTTISLPTLAIDKFVIAVGLAKPPYVIQANNTGFEIELIRNLLANMGESAEFVYTSFGHAPNMLEVDEIDAVMTTNSRVFNDLSKLSDIYITYENIAISLKDKNLTINSISDLANYSVASFQKADKILGTKFENAVNKSPFFLQIADQKRQPILLMKERVDTVVMDKNIFNYFVRELKISNPENKFAFHYIFPKSHYKMAFKNRKNIPRFNKTLLEYSKSKEYQALLKKYKLLPF
jgi:polar amino acid transport system substrate-binding protein